MSEKERKRKFLERVQKGAGFKQQEPEEDNEPGVMDMIGTGFSKVKENLGRLMDETPPSPPKKKKQEDLSEGEKDFRGKLGGISRSFNKGK